MFNDDIEPRVVRVQKVMTSHDVGFKVLGVLLNAARVKSLAISGVAIYGTISSFLVKFGSDDGSSTIAPNNTQLHSLTN